MKLRASLASVLWIVGACEGGPPPPIDAPRDTPPRDAPGQPLATPHAATLGPIRVAPGGEETVCMGIELDNELPGSIVAIRAHLTEGSHHMIVSRADDATPTSPTPCQPFALGIDRTLFIAQQRESALVYPAGTGLRVRAHQPLRLELHYINYFADVPADISGTIEVDIATEDGELRQVRLLFTGDLSFTLPPRMATTVSSTHTLPVGAELFAITSHTHRLGTFASIDRVSPEGTTRLHESDSWSDPPLDVFDPPLVLGLADEIALNCEFQNNTDEEVRFGEEFDREMCFLWAYYVEPL